MHQGIGLEAFNTMPMRRAVHAVYECCYSVPVAADLARGRRYDNHDELFRQADRPGEQYTLEVRLSNAPALH